MEMVKRLRKLLLSGAIVALLLSTGTAQVKNIELDNSAVKKNLSESYVGYDAEDFACGFNFNWMLTEGRKQFSEYCKAAGVRCLRFAEMSRYSWRGELPTRMMQTEKLAHNYPKVANVRERWMRNKLDWWFTPESFWSFCQENRIAVLPMFPAISYYNPQDKKAHIIVNNPSHYKPAAQEAAAYVKWLKDHDYLHLAKVWEIGNESYLVGWKPAEYAAYVKELVKAVRAVQPDIKLAIPTFICTPDNPDVKAVMQRMTAGNPALKGREWEIYHKNLKWSGDVIKELGEAAKYISYGVQHSYGASPSYNSNAKGVETNHKLLLAHPNSKDWRLVNTEWRDRSGEDLWCHRAFRTAALWKAKFVLLMMAYPQMDYTCAHSLFAFSGGLYWSDGRKWLSQWLPGRAAELMDTNNPDGKPRFALGAFGPVVRMCNDLIDTHPLLIGHQAELGKMSSALFYKSYYSRKEPVQGDLEWLAATNEARDSISMIFVNTRMDTAQVAIKTKYGQALPGAATVQVMSCRPDMLDMLEIPGYKVPWQIENYGTNDQPAISIPGNSVVRITFPVNLKNVNMPGKRNLIKNGSCKTASKSVPEGYKGVDGAKLSGCPEGAIEVTNSGDKQTILFYLPFTPPGSASHDREYVMNFKMKAKTDKGKKAACTLLIADQNWGPVIAKKLTPDSNWQAFSEKFTLKAGNAMKMIRFNITGCEQTDAIRFKDFELQEINNNHH